MRAWIAASDETALQLDSIVSHAQYFALQDVRPAAITKKMEQGSTDVYDFAAHANPATTHKSYDRRAVKKARATE